MNFLEEYTSLTSFLRFILKTKSFEDSLPLYYKENSKKQSINYLRGYVLSIPEFRPREELWSWCQKHNLLSKELSINLKKASLQSVEKYAERFTLLSHEIT